MRELRKLVVLVAFGVGCGGSQKTDESERVQFKDQAVREIEEEERVEHRAPPRQPPPTVEEELEVEMFDLAQDRPARASSGLQIRLLAGAPEWQFEFDHHGRVTTVDYSGTPLYLEGVQYGHLYVINQLGDAVQVTLRSDVPDNPLSPQQALQIAKRERQSRLECEGEREETNVQDNGTVALRVLDSTGSETCRIVVGRYTGEVIGL